ncbi:protein FIZZY-RELATED 3-like [Actinidia eriantha]|uniref:protein FIZZY-RELATED 3-like n=1 Tax=Actinidia eriantha TaxID=165200 RepID=UPI00258C85CC|nr:protein FIZZY-RELATED 3-like [Actinidia eriantha]
MSRSTISKIPNENSCCSSEFLAIDPCCFGDVSLQIWGTKLHFFFIFAAASALHRRRRWKRRLDVMRVRMIPLKFMWWKKILVPTSNIVLDAPSLQDDFYLNLVDWSSQNVLAVGLGTCVYLWTATTSKVTKLCDLGPTDSVCSVQWTREGSYISIGTHLGQVQVWDGTQCKRVRTMSGHQTRTGVLAWSSRILSSGSRDRNILQHDLRVPNDFVSKLVGHKSEVCGLKWSHDDRELASGGNDNQLLVWNQHSQQPILKLTEHTAAVKAIAWSPHQSGLLASGGGTADRCIRFWNTTNGNQINSVDTGSQVCNLVWSKNVNELVSTHGYSQNQIMVWKYPSMAKVATLTGHSLRVLYLAMSPDGQTIVTGAGDETLRFWNVFPSTKTPAPVKDTGLWSLGRTHIR